MISLYKVDGASCQSHTVAMDRIEQIIHQSTQPFAALNELQQMGAITDVNATDAGKVGDDWAIDVGIRINLTGELHCSRGMGSKKADAKARAASRCLDKVSIGEQDIMSTLPTQLTSTAVYLDTGLQNADIKPMPINKPCTNVSESATLPSAKQMKAMLEDQMHLLQLHNIQYDLNDVSTSTVGVSIDLEVHELNHDVLLEVGLSFVRGGSSQDSTTFHLIVTEHLDIRNGRYCADQKDNFLQELGCSELVSIDEVARRVDDIVRAQIVGADKVYCIGHSIENDLRWLAAMGVTSLWATSGKCDIARAYRAMRYPGEYHDMVGMENMLPDLGLGCIHLHNGGNDAAYNLRAFTAIFKRSRAFCSLAMKMV